MRGIVQRLVAVLLAFCLVWVSGGSTAVAAAVVPDVTDEIYSLATTAEKYMSRNADGTYTMTATAKELGVSKAALDRWMNALNAVNEAVRTGYVTTDAQGRVQLTGAGEALYQAQGGWVCRTSTQRMTANETLRFQGLLNLYAAGSTGVLALIAFLAFLLPGAGAVLAAIALITSILGVGAAVWSAWIQSIDLGNGVTLNWYECNRGAGWVISRSWPTAN